MDYRKSIEQLLDVLANSPIVDEEYYTVCLSNLCDAIGTITLDITRTLEIIESGISDELIKERIHLIESVKKSSCQIETISNIIQEKVSHPDYTELDNLLYCYRKLKESGENLFNNNLMKI
jgi:hypothetical protein